MNHLIIIQYIKRGATTIIVFGGNIDVCVSNIIEGVIHHKHFPDHHRFQADNDPKHTPKKAMNALHAAEINWWRTPPVRTDLNPMEMV